MKSTKILSFVAGLSMLAATLAPIKVSAASATMSLSGATQTNGNFSTLVYENADGPVSAVKLGLSFDTAVSGVSYDYNVGPFTTVDPDGYHLAQGAEAGSRLVAKVSFTLANPGSVTASINTVETVVKGTTADKKSLVVYTVGTAGANFTYNAPAQGGMGGGSNGTTTTTTSGRNTAVAQNTDDAAVTTAAPVADDKAKAEVKADETKVAQDDTKNKEMVQNTADKKRSPWPWIILVVVAVAATAYALRNRAAVTKKDVDAKVVTPEAPKASVAAPAAAAAAAAAIAAKKANNTSNKNQNKKSGKKSR